MIGMLVTPYAEDAFGQLGIAMDFFGYAPKKGSSPSPRLPKCQNLGFLMGFCMFLTKKQKHALCIHMDLSCKKFRIFRMGLETKVSQRAHCNCNGPGGGPVDRNCGTFQAPKFFDEVFEKMTDPTLPSHDPWWWWRSRFGWSQFCKESFMGIPKHTETINFPAEKEGICLLKTGNPHPEIQLPSQIRQVSYQGEDTIPVRDTKVFRARPPDHSWRPSGLRLGKMWPFFGRFELRIESVLLRGGF